MNPDQPSREQIEARITALLLGELPADEAALLRYTIAQDPALQKLHDQLQSALPLVREAAKHPADAPAEKPAPLKLSTDRREKLLAHFKIPRPQAPQEPLFWLKRIEMPRLIPTLVAVAIIALLAAMLLPARWLRQKGDGNIYRPNTKQKKTSWKRKGVRGQARCHAERTSSPSTQRGCACGHCRADKFASRHHAWARTTDCPTTRCAAGADCFARRSARVRPTCR